MRKYIAAFAVVLVPTSVSAQMLWDDVTQSTIGTTDGWTHRVELADIDGDGDLDMLFANGGNYSTPGQPEPNQAWLNDGNGGFEDVSAEVFGTPDLTRVIKARDINGDGHVDLVIGATYGNASRLLLGGEGLAFTDASDQLPGTADSLGDLEFGDIDGDGDLDIVVIDWGAGDGLSNAGGKAIIWQNDGNANFSVVSLPDATIRMSWDIELVDIDNDLDLDILVASKVGLQNELFINQGDGRFEVASERLPQFIGMEGFEAMDMNRDGDPEANNYDFEPIDIDGDGFLDLVTVNDGDLVDAADMFHRREHVFLNDQEGGFVDATEALWPASENIGWDDNAAVVLDFDSDGDADFLLASLSGPDRLLVNNDGQFTLHGDIMAAPNDTPGTLGIALGDLNGDDRLDLVQTQGEIAFDERVYLATDNLAPDTAAPQVGAARIDGDTLLVRVHDNRSPLRSHDMPRVVAKWGDDTVELAWYGESLWRGTALGRLEDAEVCGTDRAGNEGCALLAEANGTKSDEVDDDSAAASNDSAGCATVPGSAPVPAWLILLGFVALRRRR